VSFQYNTVKKFLFWKHNNHFIKNMWPLPIQPAQQAYTELEIGIINYGMHSTVHFEALIGLFVSSFTIRLEELIFSWEFLRRKLNTSYYYGKLNISIGCI